MDKYGSSYELQYNGGLEIPTSSFKTMYKNLPLAHEEEGNRQFSLKTEPDISYTEFEHYISISSSNRDSTNYPLHYNYRINFDFPYKNVKKIELISAIFPNQPASSSGGDILNESHLIIDIEQFNYIEFPNNTGSNPCKGFAILPLNPATKTSGGFINPELGCVYHKSKIFKTPLASLDHISIKIRDYQGNLYDFGHPNGNTTKSHQNHFVFKITTEETNRKVLNQRNVF